MIDLFGQEVSETPRRPPGWTLKRAFLLHYHKAAETEERRCKTCVHLLGHTHQRRYYKCARLGESCGTATDIRLSYVCDWWEKR
jgi:hypothetical protein